MEKDRKLNWKQACEILGCGKTKFYHLVYTGKLPAIRVGIRGIRVREIDLYRLIELIPSEINIKK